MLGGVVDSGMAPVYRSPTDPEALTMAPNGDPVGQLEDAGGATLTLPSAPIPPGRYHNCKDPCGADGCLGWPEQLTADRREVEIGRRGGKTAETERVARAAEAAGLTVKRVTPRE